MNNRFLNTILLCAGLAISAAWCKRTAYIDDLAVYEDADDGTGFKLDHQNIQTPYGQAGRILNDGVSTKFFFQDHLGSTRVVMNDGGAIQEAFEYYSYGNIKNLMVYARPTREKFTGKEFDEDGKGPGIVGMQLSYFGARYYDADIGMWISPDPKKEFNSPYTYVGDNPVGSFDPDGMGEIRVAGQPGSASFQLGTLLLNSVANTQIGGLVINQVKALPQDVYINARETGQTYEHGLGSGQAMSTSTTGNHFLQSIGLGWLFGAGDASINVDAKVSREHTGADATTLIVELQNVVDNTNNPGVAQRTFQETGGRWSETPQAIDAGVKLLEQSCPDTP